MCEHKPINILLVEDDEVDSMAVRRAFRKCRTATNFTEAKDGMDALELLRRGEVPNPCIILLDINMPRMNGIEFLAEIRKDPAFKSLVVFVLTTSKAEEDKIAAYSFNIAGYIVKEKIGKDFAPLVTMLNNFWKIVELPVG